MLVVEEISTLVSVSVPLDVTSNCVTILPEPEMEREIPVKLASPVPTLTSVGEADVMLNFDVAFWVLFTVSVSDPTVIVVTNGEYVPSIQVIA